MVEPQDDPAAIAHRLRIRCLELERALDWNAERVRQLEAFLAAAAVPLPLQPVPRLAASDDDLSRYVERIELFEAELELAARNAAEKEAVIQELARASAERLATIERIDAEAAALRSELETLRARLRDDEPAV